MGPLVPRWGWGDGGFQLAIIHPQAGAVFLESFDIAVSVGAPPETVEFLVAGEAQARCARQAPPFRCLLHLGDLPASDVTLEARAVMGGQVITSDTVALQRREALADVCGTSTALGDVGACVRTLAADGGTAGWTGVTSENRDGLYFSSPAFITSFSGTPREYAPDTNNLE